MSVRGKAATKTGGGAESGFSLIELMIAMVVTLIVTGAIYGLIAGGQSAFRVQPERSDRQQAIRTAMDLIMRDISSAGSGMPPLMQTFTRFLDGVGPMGPENQATDELELVGNPSNFAAEDACAVDNAAATSVFLQRNDTMVPVNRVVLIAMTNGTWTMRNINQGISTGTAAGACGNPVELQFTGGADPSGMNADGGICGGTPPCTIGNSCVLPDGTCTPAFVMLGEQVRYRIRNGADGVPNLERYSSASYNSGFQIVARGIEDLQVEYVQANSACTPAAPCASAPAVVMSPPPVTTDYDTIITQVRVTLSSRSSLQRIQGATTAATGPAALRGQLVATGTPRAALFAVNQQPQPTPVWR